MHKLLSLLILQAFFILPAASAQAADTWVLPETAVSLQKTVKATATLYYTDPDTGSDKTIKYTPTSIGFSLDRSVDPLATGFLLKGDSFQIDAAMTGDGYKSKAITVIAASSGNPLDLILADTANNLCWTTDTIMAGIAEGSFTENMDKKTKAPDGTIKFKLTYIIAGTLSNKLPGRLVVTFTGSKLAGQ